MSRIFIRRAFTALLAFVVWPSAVARAGDAPATVLLESSDRTILQLRAPVAGAIRASDDPRYVEIRLPGFGEQGEAGMPRLPVWVGRVAIPEGAVPRLLVRQAPSVRLPELRPAPFPTHDLLHLPGGGSPPEAGVDVIERLIEDPFYYAGESTWPAIPVELGPEGRFRHQRYVEVHYRPVSYDATGALVWFPQVEVELQHAAPESQGAPGPLEPAWEPLYRSSFLNYGAGRALRAARPQDSRKRDAGEAVATTDVFKISVLVDGVHRVDHATLNAAAPTLAATDPRTWHVENRGVEIPVRILGEEDGVFDPADTLEFLGEARAEPDMMLEVDLSPAPALYRDLDVGGVNIYLLTASGAPGAGQRMATLDGAPDPMTPLPAEADFVHTEWFEEETVFTPLTDDDAWYWGPRTNSLDVGGTTAPATRVMSLDLPGLTGATYSAAVHVSMRGTTSLSQVDPDHPMSFLLNGQALPDLLFDGDGAAALDTTVDQGITLSDPATLEITAEPVFDGPTQLVNEIILNRVAVTYRRAFQGGSGSLRFDHADGDFGFEITDLPDPLVHVLDLSDPIPGSSVPAPIKLTGVEVVQEGPTWTARFEIHPTGTPTRKLLLASDAGITDLAAGSILLDTPSDLANPANGAAYILITHPDLVDTTGGSSYNQFLAAKAAAGLPVFTAYVDDIYDEFSDSLPGPEAIRDFLAFAFTSWTGWDADGDLTPDPPRFVLFLGDASFDVQDRFDYSSLPQGFFNKVPTTILYQRSTIFAWFSSDIWMASVAGVDYLPEFHLGRLSSRSMAESEMLLQKVVDYEAAAPAGPWRAHATLLAGEGKSQLETDEFERISAEIESDYVVPPFTSSHLYYFTDFGGTDEAGMNTAIIDAIDTGTAFLQFIGHGNFNKLGLATLYLAADVAVQLNGGMQPFVVIENCLSGGFSWHFDRSMGEELTQDPDDGAIAAFAPAGLSTAFVGEPLADAMLEAAYGRDKVREIGALADIGLLALSDANFIVDMMAYELLGDPGLRLIFPAPAAPRDPLAVADNGVVHLSWTASVDPVDGYQVLRTEDPAQPYTVVNGPLIVGTSFDDATVVNSTTYYFAVIAVETGGFESAWSNQNRDCDVSGPDCLEATPVNPFPPAAPTGVGVEPAPAKPDELRVFWAPNSETDVALYRVRYGTTPASYTAEWEVDGSAAEALIGGLLTGTTYFFVVEAENTGGLISALSGEVSGVPQLILGTRPPAAVSGLQLAINSGDPTSVDLTWDPVTTDIYGLSETVASYEIYVGSTSTFVPDLGFPLESVAAPGLAFTHTGGVLVPNSLYYLVVAVDDEGLRSPVGQDLPDGIRDLEMTLQGDGITVDLTWSPVTTTIGGESVQVIGYQVHGAAMVLTVPMLGPSTLLGEPAAPGFSHVPPVNGFFYYTVVAVDPRGSTSPF